MKLAQAYQISVVKPFRVIFSKGINMMNLKVLIIKPVHCVVSSFHAHSTEVFAFLSYLYAFVCPCLGLAESVTLSVTAFLSACLVFALMSSGNYPTVSASH